MGAACRSVGCKGELPCDLSVSHEFCETTLLVHFWLFLSPGLCHQPLREMMGSGINLKPHDPPHLKASVSSETNSLSLDLVYEPLLSNVFSWAPLVVQVNIHLMGTVSLPSRQLDMCAFWQQWDRGGECGLGQSGLWFPVSVVTVIQT